MFSMLACTLKVHLALCTHPPVCADLEFTDWRHGRSVSHAARSINMPYNPGLTCHWQLQAPNDFVVVVNFFNVSIGSGDCLNFAFFNDTTNQLNVSIFDSSPSLNFSFCEGFDIPDLPAPLDAEGVAVDFVTADSASGEFFYGFNVTFEFVKDSGEVSGTCVHHVNDFQCLRPRSFE
jgi:hypothetical protein